MIKFSSTASGNKSSEASGLAAVLRRIGDRMFAGDDRRALQHGWQVSVRHGGLSRRYRDPRFGWLSACPWCRGSGHLAELGCPACRGTGRVSLRRPGSRWGGDGDAQQPLAQAQ